MANKNFIVKNGLEVGGQEVVSSSGVVTSAALGGQQVSSSDSPTFSNLTITNDLGVSGDINLTGDLNITGDLNSVSVTDLDVTDKTITLGVGQVESASGGSGIVVAGSSASILWDETNTEWDFNNPIHPTGVNLGQDEYLQIGGATELQVWNDGTNSVIRSSDNLLIQRNTTPRSAISITDSSGEVALAYGGSTVFQTTSTGAAVTGTADVSSQVLVGGQDSIFAENNIRFKSAGAAYIDHNTVSQDIIFRISNSSSLDTTMMVLDAGVQSVGINTASPSSTYKLDVAGSIRSASSAPGFHLRDDSASNQHWTLGSYSGTFAIRDVTQGSVYPFLIEAGADGNSILIDAGGNVGIGTSNPSFASGSGLEIERAGIATLRFQNSNSKSVEITQDSDFKIESMNSGADIILMPTANVGIGTTSPSRKLSVQSDTTQTSGFNDITEFLDTTIGAGGSVSLNVGRANSTKNLGKMAFKYAGSGSNSNALNFGFYDADNLMTLTANAMVGISNTDPSAKLHIGTANSVGSQTDPAIQFGGAGNYRLGIYTTAEGSVFDNKNGDDGHIFNVKTVGEAMRIQGGDGKVMIGGTAANFAQLGIESGGDATFEMYSASGTGTRGKSEIFFSADGSVTHHSIASLIVEQPEGDQASRKGQFRFRVSDNSGPADALTIQNNKNCIFDGNVGIGASSPQYKLDVYGTSDVTMRIHRPSSGLASTDTCGIGFSQRGDTSTSSSDTRAGIFSTYNGNLFLATEPSGNLNSNPMDHSALMITGSGQNVGIGTTSPSNKLTVDAGTFAGYMAEFIQGGGGGGNHGPRIVSGSASSYAFIVRANASTVFYVDGSGNYYFSGSNQSDINKKENIDDITDNALDLITQLEPKTYNFIGNDKDKAGFIAQDMENVIPLLVTGNEYDPEAGPNTDENPTGKGIDYMGYTAYLTKAIQELKTELDAAKARIEVLEG